MRALAAALALSVLLPMRASAHGAASAVAEWTFDPWIILPLAISMTLYAAGLARLWRKAGVGRGIAPWRPLCFCLGCLALAIALVSPLHWLGERLFTFHMIEHEIVMAIAAPLIAAARPMGALVWALPARGRIVTSVVYALPGLRRLWKGLSSARNATLLHGLAIWIWHAPAFFDAAVVHVEMHRLQHICFFATGVLFWGALWRSADFGLAAAHLFLTMLHTSVLGALMALAPRVLYVAQTASAATWGLTPLEDQQLAGIVMWIPAGTIYAGTALVFAALWIKRSSKAVVSHVHAAV